jgi:tetratricopeptide (TPR) repeat protein
VGPHHPCRLRAFAIASWLTLVAAAAAAQSVPDPVIQQKLNRVGADLFSTTPHPAAAIEELKAILAAEPELAEAHMLLGIAYGAQRSPDLMGEAVAELRQAIALKPSLVMARLILARVYIDMARAGRAREELEVALEQLPGQPQPLSLLGEAERQLGNPRRSVELNRQALQADATFVQARYYLGLALIDLRQHTDAIREMQLVVKSDPGRPEAHLGLGTAYLHAGRVTDAVAALRQAATLDPSRAETHIQLARAYRSKGLFDDALKELKLAMPAGSAVPGGLSESVEQDVHMEEGLVRMQQGRLEAAADAFQRVLALDSTHGPAKRQLAEVRKRLQENARKKKSGEPDRR